MYKLLCMLKDNIYHTRRIMALGSGTVSFRT